MAEVTEAAIRAAYAAFGRGDVDGYLAICTEVFTFHVPGHSSVAGIWRGKPGLEGLGAKVMELTAGTFEEEVEDVLINDRHAVVLARHRFTRDGRTHKYQTAHLYDILEGKLAACWEQPRDPVAFDAAWGVAQTDPAKS